MPDTTQSTLCAFTFSVLCMCKIEGRWGGGEWEGYIFYLELKMPRILLSMKITKPFRFYSHISKKKVFKVFILQLTLSVCHYVCVCLCQIGAQIKSELKQSCEAFIIHSCHSYITQNVRYSEWNVTLCIRNLRRSSYSIIWWFYKS